MGALTGAISGAGFTASHFAIAALKKIVEAGAFQAAASSAFHVGAGAATGAINSAISGGDPGMGAEIGAVSAGVARRVGAMLGMGATKPVNQTTDMFSKDYAVQLGGRMASGAVAGASPRR